MDSLIDKFMAQIPQVITDLEFAIKQTDTKALQQLAHRLRGTADLFQAMTVSRRARELEYAGAADDFTLTGRRARELIGELQKLTATP